MVLNFSQLSLELWLRKLRTSGLNSKKPFGVHLLDQVPDEITLMLLFLFFWSPKTRTLTPPYLKQLLEAEDVKLRLFTGGMTKSFLFQHDTNQLIAKHHDPSPIFITVIAYLSHLPEPLMVPKCDWHSLGHDIVEDSLGYHPKIMKRA